jgi:hypothetical protein
MFRIFPLRSRPLKDSLFPRFFQEKERFHSASLLVILAIVFASKPRLSHTHMKYIRTNFLIITLFYDSFKYGNGAKFSVCVGTHAESLCVKFCNFVQCFI